MCACACVSVCTRATDIGRVMTMTEMMTKMLDMYRVGFLMPHGIS